MKKLVVGLAVMLGFCMCAHQPSGTLDVNKALDYCAEQTQRTCLLCTVIQCLIHI